MRPKVRKVVIPAAGLGTRFLPATKAMPKEMLCVVDKPIIQYAVEEAVASGIEHVIIVTGRSKSSMEDHFDISYELETTLRERGKHDLVREARKVSDLASVSYVRQKEPLGLGHAVLAARDLVGNEPFAVMLPDDLIDAPGPPALRQMIDVFERGGDPVIALPFANFGPGPAKLATRGGAIGFTNGTKISPTPGPGAAPHPALARRLLPVCTGRRTAPHPFSATASRAMRSTSAGAAPRGHIHEPPTQATFFSAR